MSQNLISLNLSAEQLAAIDQALASLEANFAGLTALEADARRSLVKMGDKSEAFCRQTLAVLVQNPQVVPPSLDLAEAQRDLATVDALRPRLIRLRQLLERADDTDIALGSDLMNVALEGYALLRVSGKGSGLEQARQALSARFNRRKPGTGSSPASGT